MTAVAPVKKYATGYIDDPASLPRTPFLHLAAVLGADVPDACSLEAHLPGCMDQGQTGSCTGHGTSGAVYTTCDAQGSNIGFVPSPDDLYKGGRAIDRARDASGRFPALQDQGAAPNQVARFMNVYGIRPMGPMAPDGRNSDVDPSTVNDEPNLVDLEQDATCVLVGEYQIFGTAEERAAQVRQAIANGYAVGCAVPGGSNAWQNNEGDKVAVLGPTGTELDHWVFLYGYEKQSDGTYLWKLRNSWGRFWGTDGNGLADDAAFAEFGNVIVYSVHKVAVAAKTTRRAA